MNLSKFRFTLDLHSIQSQASIPVMVGDTSVTLIITITDGGLPYHIEDGCLAKISIKRPTGTHLEEFCVVKNNAVVEYAFSQNENTCAVPGVHICDIILYGADGGVVGTPRFTMVVSERVIRFDDIVLTDEDFTASEAMMKQEGTRQEQERLRVIAEEKRVAAEEERFAACEDAVKASAEARADAERAEKAAEHASEIANNFDIGAYVEQDPTVPAWAKQPNPPTAAEIGAAPAGFGLGGGGFAIDFSQVDTIKSNGWYAFVCPNTMINNITFHYAYMFVEGWDINSCRQTLYPVHAESSVLIRNCYAGTWQPWEVENPPMQLGVEYRTTERWMGKAVYTILWDCGALPNNTTKSVITGLTYTEVISIIGITNQDSDYNPIGAISGVTDLWVNYPTNMWINVQTNSDKSAKNLKVIIKYTKD